MNYQQFLDLERLASRAIRAACTFATASDSRQLQQLTTIMAELRHAADYLCDPKAQPEEKQQAAKRLLELFTENP